MTPLCLALLGPVQMHLSHYFGYFRPKSDFVALGEVQCVFLGWGKSEHCGVMSELGQ